MGGLISNAEAGWSDLGGGGAADTQTANPVTTTINGANLLTRVYSGQCGVSRKPDGTLTKCKPKKRTTGFREGQQAALGGMD